MNTLKQAGKIYSAFTRGATKILSDSLTLVFQAALSTPGAAFWSRSGPACLHDCVEDILVPKYAQNQGIPWLPGPTEPTGPLATRVTGVREHTCDC